MIIKRILKFFGYRQPMWLGWYTIKGMWEHDSPMNEVWKSVYFKKPVKMEGFEFTYKPNSWSEL